MPLYNYKCKECEHMVEKFQHNAEDILEIICEECGSKGCEKQLPFANSRVWLDAKELYNEKIAPDARRIMDNMKKDKDNAFFDIYGDN